MKKWTLIVGGHVLGVTVLIGCGWWFGGLSGVITAISGAWGVYTTIGNWLYNRNPRFHLFVNRLWFRFSRTHTYWQPSFDFEYPARSPLVLATSIDELWEMLQKEKDGKAQQRERTPTTLGVSLDNLFDIRFRAEETRLHCWLDRKLLVPGHLYDTYRQRLSRLAEDIAHVVKPDHLRCGLTISFDDGVKNPYYGFFVNRVAPEVLQTFEVSFHLRRNSDCRIEAGVDHVSIEGTSLAEMFEAANQVLNLQAVPEGSTP